MHISKNGISLITKYEGCILHSYKCPAGVYTIGYGHTTGVRPNMRITQKEAEELLIQDLKKYESIVNAYDNIYHWSQNQFDALCSFAFNIGNITTLTASGTRNKFTIAEKMLLYVKANGKILNGLVKRRKEEHDLFLSESIQMKSDEEVAKEVIEGLWENGKERTKLLKEAGYKPRNIQKLVNEMLNTTN